MVPLDKEYIGSPKFTFISKAECSLGLPSGLVLAKPNLPPSIPLLDCGAILGFF